MTKRRKMLNKIIVTINGVNTEWINAELNVAMEEDYVVIPLPH